MENKYNLKKNERRVLERSRKSHNLPIIGSAIRTDRIFILAMSLFLLILISGGAFLKYQDVLSKIEKIPESNPTSQKDLDIEDVRILMNKLEAKKAVLKKLE